MAGSSICNTRTGFCIPGTPKPDGSLCPGGTCQTGLCQGRFSLKSMSKPALMLYNSIEGTGVKGKGRSHTAEGRMIRGLEFRGLKDKLKALPFGVAFRQGKA